MYYYAYINANNIVTQIITLPSVITVANYIPISSADAALFVGKDESGYYAVSMAELVFPLIAAVQELAARVKELEK